MVVTGGGAAGTTNVPVAVVATTLEEGVGTSVMVLGTAVQIPGFWSTKAAQMPTK